MDSGKQKYNSIEIKHYIDPKFVVTFKKNNTTIKEKHYYAKNEVIVYDDDTLSIAAVMLK